MTGKYEEKHAKAVDTDMGFFDDKKTHIFRLGQLTDQLSCAILYWLTMCHHKELKVPYYKLLKPPYLPFDIL